MKHFRWMLLLTFVLMMVAGTAVQAQEVTAPYAVVLDNDLWVYGVGDEPVLVMEGTQGGFSSINWSADGSKLIFIRYNEDYSTSLMVADVSNLTAPTEITLPGLLESGFPTTFTPDGQILFAQQAAEFPTGDDPYMTEFYTLAPTEGATPQLVGSVPLGIGCGGGSSIPSDWAYWSDTGFGGYYLTLESTAAGIVYSMNCSGVGTGLLNLGTGESVTLGTELARVKISPDGTQLAGVSTNYSDAGVIGALQIVDLATQTVTDVPTESNVEQLAWGTDGTLFYSTRTADSNLLVDLTDEQRSIVYAALGIPEPADPAYAGLPHYSLTINHFNPATGEDTIVYTGDGYAIGRIAALDAETLVFSQIPNLNAWVEGLVNGTLVATAEDYAVQTNSIVAPQLYTLNLSDGSTEQFAAGWFRITPFVAS